MSYLLPSEQTVRAEKAIEDFKRAGSLTIYEPCNCGSHVRHNNGENYHVIIDLARDGEKFFVKYGMTSELVPSAEWQACQDWQGVIREYADWL